MNRTNQKRPVRVVMIGAGGHARVVADMVRLSGDIVEGFLDDRDAGEFPGLDMLGHVFDAQRLSQERPELRFIIGIGKNEVRQAIAGKLQSLCYHIAIHPSAVIASDCAIAPGTVVMANAVLNTGSSVGRHCIINTAATVDHDGLLGDFVHLSPGVHLSGAVQLGRGNWLGVGSVVSNNVSICAGCTVGAGAVVIKDILKPGTYVGVPAEKISF